VTAAQVVLIAIAGWTALSVVVAVVLFPLLRSARRAEELEGGAAHGSAHGGSPSALRESGYLGIVLERLVLHACTVFAADEVCLFAYDRRARGEALVLVQAAGVDPELVGRRLTIEWDPVVAALACGRPIAIPGELWPAWQGAYDAGEPVRSAAIAPVWFGGRMQGAVSVIHRGDGPERAATALAPLGELAELAGRALCHTERRQLSAGDPQPEIDALLATMARSEPAGAGHAELVAAIARRLADDLGLGGPDLIELELAARLHDVGRLRTPARVLRPAAQLTSSERELLRLQPLWAAELVARIPGLEAVALIVRHCHERFDGIGYPDGLTGDRIPLASRIVALARAVAVDAGATLAVDRGAYDPDLLARLNLPAATATRAAA
jgi:HD-GYP domain-containing protein (c-di-GMP phosphodiesterase class II)